MAIRSMFVWRSTRSNELLEVGRARPPVRYDSQAALARHQGLVRMGAAPPSWADPRIFGLVKSAGPVVTAPWVACSAVVIAAGVAAAAHARSGAQLTAAVAPSRVAVHAAPPASVAVAGAATAPWAPSAESPSAVEATASPAPLEAVRGPAAPHAHEAAKAGAPGGGRARRALRDADATSAGPSTASAANASSAEPAPTDDPAVASPVVAPSATDADDRREMQETSAAARLLATDPSRALALVRASDARFPNGYMREERRYVAVMALFALGRRSEARAAAGVFLHEHPTGTFSDKIRAAMAGDGNAGR